MGSNSSKMVLQQNGFEQNGSAAEWFCCRTILGFFSSPPRISIIPGGDNKKEHKALVLSYTIYRTALGGFKL